jgi:hypothetical protein
MFLSKLQFIAILHTFDILLCFKRKGCVSGTKVMRVIVQLNGQYDDITINRKSWYR